MRRDEPFQQASPIQKSISINKNMKNGRLPITLQNTKSLKEDSIVSIENLSDIEESDVSVYNEDKETGSLVMKTIEEQPFNLRASLGN